MYHSILVPLDGSQFAEQSLPLALSIANRAVRALKSCKSKGLYALEDPHCRWVPYDREEDIVRSRSKSRCISTAS